MRNRLNTSLSLAVMWEDNAEKMERFVAESTFVVLDLRKKYNQVT